MMKILTGSFCYSPVARHYTVFKGKINESSAGGVMFVDDEGGDTIVHWMDAIGESKSADCIYASLAPPTPLIENT
jgi:hypothetical protein